MGKHTSAHVQNQNWPGFDLGRIHLFLIQVEPGVAMFTRQKIKLARVEPGLVCAVQAEL